MRGSWRDRPTGSFFSRLWRPWVSLNPFRGRGRRINEAKTVGIRDLVAGPEAVTHRPERRWGIIGGFFALLLVLLLGRLFVLQVLNYKSSVATVRLNSLRSSSIPAPRGLIVDRSGHAMVANVTTTEVQLSRAEAALDPAIKGTLSSLTGVSITQINADLANQQYNPYQPAPILLDASASVVEYLKLHPREFPGVSVLKVARRTYPFGGSVGSQVLGYVGPITENEIKAHPGQGYQTDSEIGKTGIESYYESFLRGHDGQRTFEVDAFGNILSATKVTQPRAGDTVVLNIDEKLQSALDGFLAHDIVANRLSLDPRSGKHPPSINGAAVVLDPNTGAVLAMSSYPSFNLNSFINGLSESTFKQLLKVGAFNNYAIQGQYTPGSTFKMISATAELQTGILSPYYTVDDNGTFRVPHCRSGCVFHDDETAGSGPVDLSKALTVSSDYYFYNLGYQFWTQRGKYGETPIQNVGHLYGLDQYTNVDLPNEVEGRVDSPAVRKVLHAEAPADFRDTWFTGDNIEMAFGQGTTAVTPIAMANAYATFANGGTRYTPEVAAAVLNPHGKVIERYAPRVAGHVSLPARVRGPILQGLTGVVDSPSGTGYYAFQAYFHHSLASFPIAGKTGTASNAPGLEPNSWFVGFGPTTHAQYVVLCVIDQGGYGADAAAPVVAETFNYLVSHPIPPVRLAAPLSTTSGSPTTTTTARG
ncbi:MAG: penicillin-binding protein 2 [Acidimicrobiales bacterium]